MRELLSKGRNAGVRPRTQIHTGPLVNPCPYAEPTLKRSSAHMNVGAPTCAEATVGRATEKRERGGGLWCRLAVRLIDLN